MNAFVQTTGASTIAFSTVNYPDDSGVAAAADAWNLSCTESGIGFPALTTGSCFGSSSCIQIYVQFASGISTNAKGSCGNFLRTTSGGTTTGGTITMFEYDTQARPCAGDALAVLMHEMGHALGLGDTDEIASCFGSVMSGWWWGSVPTIDAEACAQAQQNWETPIEDAQASCNATCWTVCDASAMCPPGTMHHDNDTSWYDPLVFDLHNDGIETTGGNHPVLFDLDGDGALERITWLGPADAFLWTDLNGNHRLDDGSELFGVGTTLPDGTKARHGYEALAVYDRPEAGGDGNGFIDAADAIWNRLRLWRDANSDGHCNPGEALPIHRYAVERISLDWRAARWIDGQGNVHLLRGTYRKHAGSGAGEFLVEALTFRSVF